MYPYLMLDEDNFIYRSAKYRFTTEGHAFPLSHSMQSMFSQHRVSTLDAGAGDDSYTNTCPLLLFPTRSRRYYRLSTQSNTITIDLPINEIDFIQFLSSDCISTVGILSFLYPNIHVTFLDFLREYSIYVATLSSTFPDIGSFAFTFFDRIYSRTVEVKVKLKFTLYVCVAACTSVLQRRFLTWYRSPTPTPRTGHHSRKVLPLNHNLNLC